MDPQVIRHMALLMSVNCVRKTVLDDYLNKGKLSPDELQAFMTECTDKLYTFLTFLLDRSEEDKQLFLEVMNNSYPDDWEQPEIAPVFEEAVALLKARRQQE